MPGAARGGEPPASDDEWERFQRELADGGALANAPKEPSARARMVAERLRREDEERGRRDERRASGPRVRRQGGGWTGWAALLVLGALVAGAFLMGRIDLPGSGGRSGGEAARTPGQPMVAPPGEALPDAATLDAPFAGSPAEDYAAGIVLPKARPVGRMTVKQVDFALRRTRELIVAAHLDPAVLRGGRPTAAIALLDPKPHGVVPTIERSLKSPTEKDDPVHYFPRFDPAKFTLVGDAVKVRGEMTFREGEHGAVAVLADYTFVYPVKKARTGADEVSRVIIRRMVEISVSDPARVAVTPGKLWVVRWDGEKANAGCGFTGGYLVPDFAGDAAVGDEGDRSGELVDPYDRERAPRQDEAGCGTVTRT